MKNRSGEGLSLLLLTLLSGCSGRAYAQDSAPSCPAETPAVFRGILEGVKSDIEALLKALNEQEEIRKRMHDAAFQLWWKFRGVPTCGYLAPANRNGEIPEESMLFHAKGEFEKANEIAQAALIETAGALAYLGAGNLPQACASLFLARTLLAEARRHFEDGLAILRRMEDMIAAFNRQAYNACMMRYFVLLDADGNVIDATFQCADHAYCVAIGFTGVDVENGQLDGLGTEK